VIWHTQGSGKSLLMAFYAGLLVRHPVLENPTVLVITDRNDLDDQLFGTFSMCSDLIRQKPAGRESRSFASFAGPGFGRCDFHHDPKVRARRWRCLSRYQRPAEHHRDGG
jgi:hypothetical protein